MEPKLQSGDVVKLKCGGAPMVITHVLQGSRDVDVAEVVYFDTAGVLQHSKMSVNALVKSK